MKSQYQAKSPMNERGSTTLFGITIIMALSLCALFFIKKRIDYTLENEKLQKLLLCTKKTNGITKDFFDKMSQTNNYLKTLTMTKYGSILIPIYGVMASKSAAQAIKIVKAIQVGYLISHLNKLKELTQNNCYLSPNTYTTPFELALNSGFKRNRYEEAKLRGKTWKYANLNSKKMIVTKLQFIPTWKIKSTLLNLGTPF